MNISAYQYLILAPISTPADQGQLEAMTLACWGHKRHDEQWTPALADLRACYAWLERSDSTFDPYCQNIALFCPDLGTREDQHANKVAANHVLRMRLNCLENQFRNKNGYLA